MGNSGILMNDLFDLDRMFQTQYGIDDIESNLFIKIISMFNFHINDEKDLLIGALKEDVG